MAPPNHDRPEFVDGWYQTGRLRVVQNFDVLRLNLGAKLISVGTQHLGIDGSLIVAQGRAVADRTMESVVKPLGDLKELGRAIDNDPPRVNSNPTDVRQQRPKHLGDSSARRRRVHVPDG